MPNIFEITQLAQRTIEIDIRGLKLKVTERLMQNPKGIIDLRNKAKRLETVYREALAVAKEGKGTDPFAGLETQLAELEMSQVNDRRALVISSLVARVEAWDLVDAKKQPIPLNEETLYFESFPSGTKGTAPIPTEAFEEILEAINKEPIVPNGKS